MKYFILLAIIFCSLTLQAQTIFKPGTYKKGEIVKDISGNLWRAKTDIGKASAAPKAGTYWEAVAVTPVLTLDSLERRVNIIDQRLLFFERMGIDSFLWRDGDGVHIGLRYKKN